MKPLKIFTIPFVGLKAEKTHVFEYQITPSFFEHFEYNEFNDIKIQARVALNKKTTFLELSFKAQGFINLNCDVSNEPYDQPLAATFDLIVKFGDNYNDEDPDILIVPHGTYQINVAQYIYELIVLAIPIKRIHPGIADDSLDSEILKKLETLSPLEKNKGTDPRWDGLKQLLTDK